MLIEAARPFLENGSIRLTIVGDGPEADILYAMRRELQQPDAIRFTGNVLHADVHNYLASADLFVFPSIREFGGAVVLEAMSMGAVPIVVNYGGPGELVTPATGFLIRIGTRKAIVAALRETLQRIVDGPQMLREMSHRAVQRARTSFTWESKANQVLQVYDWVLKRGPKPCFEQTLLANRPDEPHCLKPIMAPPKNQSTTLST